MKLVVQIPAFNEEKTIEKVIKSIPRKISKISKVEILVVNDGSKDNTAKVAKKAGANHIVSHNTNLGLAKTFNTAVKKSLQLKADIIVNTDGDDQYNQKEIPKLIAPILLGQADMVIGNRQVEKLVHMPKGKKFGNIIGSFIIRKLAGVSVIDASSGFRAFNRKTAESFHLFSNHTYTHETIIQAVNKDLIITEIPVTFKKRTTGKSRLISGVIPHIKKSATTIIRTILMYKAFKVMVSIGSLFVVLGIIGLGRFAYFFFQGNGTGHLQSLIFSSILISVGLNTILMGVIADLISINRKLIEK